MDQIGPTYWEFPASTLYVLERWTRVNPIKLDVSLCISRLPSNLIGIDRCLPCYYCDKDKIKDQNTLLDPYYKK